MVTVTFAFNRGYGGVASKPSTLAGVVAPAPVPQMLTQSPRATGFAAEFPRSSLAFTIAPWPAPETLDVNRPGAAAATARETGAETAPRYSTCSVVVEWPATA
jgi:hypothetical protein